MFKKCFLISLIGIGSLFASSLDIEKGTFTFSGGFLGLTNSIDTDITAYSISQHHKNLLNSSFYYKYDITWYDSDTLTQTKKYIDNYITPNFQLNPIKTALPKIDYKFQGLDANFVLGKDVIHKDENNYLGIGLLAGISLPWIDSKTNSSNTQLAQKLLKYSKTKFITYKIGPNITASKSLGDYFSIYLSGSYAYQTGKVKNKYTNLDFSADGSYGEFDIGTKFQPVNKDFKLGFITLSPRVYALIGFKYKEWKLNNISINPIGIKGNFRESDFKMSTKTTYFKVGYSF